jgi:rod shape-determining protein MreC
VRRVLVLFSAAIVLYLSVSYWYLPNSPYAQYSLQHLSSYVIQPICGINNFFTKSRGFFVDIGGWFSTRKSLNQRLENLEKIETQLQQAKLELITSQKIINQLAPLVNFIFPKDFKKVTTRVYGSPVGFYDAQLIVGAPLEIALQKDDVAICDKGLVGRVFESSNRMVRIMLITDMASRVPVKILETGENGIALGSGASVMTLEHLQSREMITNSYKRPPEVGDVLVTSGIGGIFPPDLPVGRVSSIKDDEITIKPFVIFHTLEIVTILYDHVEL